MLFTYNHIVLNVSCCVCPQFIKRFINSSWSQRYGEAPRENTVTFIWSAVVSIFALGGLLGSISVRWFSNQLGRKKAMIWNNAINVVALGTMVASKSANYFEMILLSRLGGSLHILYLGESSPKKIRGMVTLTVATFKAVGKMTGQIAGLSEILGREDWWNILLGVPAFFSIIQMVTLPFFPEAPRYLLIEKAVLYCVCIAALQCLWGPGDYKLEIEEMLVEQAAQKGERSKTLLELLRDQSVRWQLLTIKNRFLILPFLFPQISVFSFSIFQEAGISIDKIRYVTLGLGVSEILTNFTCVSSTVHQNIKNIFALSLFDCVYTGPSFLKHTHKPN
uniref:Solute carrier family 2 member 9, like 1 n=1 Tax=Astyanax mexicanus TaxID=7994 RepID=A0A8B9JN74_ASTMX